MGFTQLSFKQDNTYLHEGEDPPLNSIYDYDRTIVSNQATQIRFLTCAVSFKVIYKQLHYKLQTVLPLCRNKKWCLPAVEKAEAELFF